MASHHTSCIILAGGEARRMGGIDKGLQHFRNKPLVAHVVASISPQVDDIVISANRNIDQYKSFGCPVYPDTHNDYAGPLAGIASTIPHCKYEWILVAPCDMPFLPANLVQTMMHYTDISQLIVISTDDRLQLVLLMHRDLLDSIHQHLSQQQYSVMRWLDDVDHHVLEMPDQNDFLNINTAEQLDH